MSADTGAAGENWTRLLEGSGVNFYPEPAPHVHECPECRDRWRHADPECSDDAIPDPWYGGAPSGGYALCGDCAKPGSNGDALPSEEA